MVDDIQVSIGEIRPKTNKQKTLKTQKTNTKKAVKNPQ